ncbi:MAG: sugar ABC transporter ATP-binding protein [Planctomycetota bacterium]|jgi:inositol transport system ATP-binding protein|nr:sugar ABC transporter ATP-binding protein [Planctomycetota bacterium]
MAEEIKLELRGISKSFPGVKALDGVHFALKKGTVHALCGENGAGKSTLMKILDGVYQPDEGEIVLDRRKIAIESPIHAREHRIAMIFQELTYVPDLSIAENICLGAWPMKRKGWIDWKRIRRDAEELLRRERFPHAPETPMRSLSVSDIQMIEIIKAVNHNAEIVIMDEPTSALTEREVARLFETIASLKAREVSVVYISHKLDEIFRIADEITVLRDGKFVRTMRAGEADEATLIELMVGRKFENQFPKGEAAIGEEIMRVEGFTRRGVFENIDFNLRAGEIVGFFGLMGAGRTEIMRALFGLDGYDAGKVVVLGREVAARSVPGSIAAGMAMLPEDRRRYGIIPMRSVSENTSVSSLSRYLKNGRYHKKRELEDVRNICETIDVKTPSLETLIAALSGGNQQKVLFARWFLCDPRILILDEPTRGIDVGAKKEIYQLMTGFAGKGNGIVMVSSEMPELIGMCDRIYVLREGRITGQLARSEFSQPAIMNLAIM